MNPSMASLTPGQANHRLWIKDYLHKKLKQLIVPAMYCEWVMSFPAKQLLFSNEIVYIHQLYTFLLFTRYFYLLGKFNQTMIENYYSEFISTFGQHFFVIPVTNMKVQQLPPRDQLLLFISYIVSFKHQQDMFLEEVQVLTVDPEKLAEMENLTQTSYILADWIKLLSMYKLNQSWHKVDETVLKMEERFLLKETFWLRETQEKITRANVQKREDILEIFALFEKGLNQGEYTELAEKFATFAIQMYQDKHITLSLAESKLEYLVSVFKNNIKSGSLYFNRLRKLYKVKQTPDQITKIRRAYQRELALPFESMDVTLDEYKNWEHDEEQIKKTQKAYESVKSKLDQAIQNIKQKKLENLPPKCALSLLETESAFDESVYLSILNKLPLEEQLPILKRQSKVGRFFELYLKHLIKHSPEQQQLINHQFHRFLGMCSKKHVHQYEQLFLQTIVKRLNKHLLKQQPQQYLEAWPSKLIYFRQKITNFIEGAKDNSRKLELYSFWADVEAFIVKDPASTLNISKLQLELTKEVMYYIRFANRLIAVGKIDEVLQVLKDGRKVCNNPQQLNKEYRRFRVLFGTDDDIEDNVIEAEEANQINDNTTHNNKHHPQKKRTSNHDPQTPVENLKRPREDDAQDQLLHQKIEHQQRKRHHTDSGRTVYVNGLNLEWKQKDVIELFNNREAIVEARIVRDKSGKSKGFGYVDFASQEAAKSECQHSRTDGITFDISRPPKQYSEQRTIFLCGLPTSATDQKVRDVLGEQLLSQTDDIRLVKNEEESRGYCYVQFITVEAKTKALEELLHKKLTIDGKRILAEQCDSNRQKSKKLNQVIFLKGLAFKANEQDIRDFFAHHKLHSSITTVEIPIKNDRSQGIAFVEFSKYIDFQRALDLGTGRIHHRDFQILRSDRKITYRRQDRPQKQAASNEKPLTNEDFSKLFQK